MLKMVKKIAKMFKGAVRPKSAKVLPYRNVAPAKVTAPTLNTTPTQVEATLPTREELTARLIQTLQATVDANLQAFLKAVEEYPTYPDVYGDVDLGDEILSRLADSGLARDFGWILDYVDTESVGIAWRNDEGGRYLNRGYFQFGTIEF